MVISHDFDWVQLFVDIVYLTLMTALTSAFAAILGQGGGLLLMGILAGFVPAPALIAVHAVVQASSNGSRAYLAHKHINWPVILPVAVGIVLGASLILPFIPLLNWQWMQAVIALYILWLTWGHLLNRPNSPKLSTKSGIPFIKLGFLQGSLGMTLGATGPLGNALLLSKGLNKESIVASNAVIMLLSHLIKIIFFSVMGVQLLNHAQLLLFLCIAATAGSFVGNYFRKKIPENIFFPVFKGLLTLLAIRMFLLAFY